jgi:beta-glucosidase
MDGEEVVQCYVSFPGIKSTAPLKVLKGFQRISLAKGNAQEISFTLTASDLSLIDEQGNAYQPNGQCIDISRRRAARRKVEGC